MWLTDWFWWLLDWVLPGAPCKITLMGLDNAGKTTLLGLLKTGSVSVHNPTVNPTSETVTIGRVTFETMDLGGHEQARRLWKDFSTATDGVVFMVDAADAERFGETRRELMGLLRAEEYSAQPFAVFFNKTDLPAAVRDPDAALGLVFEDAALTPETRGVQVPGHSAPVRMFFGSVTERDGVEDPFLWLSEKIP